jgi:hypothetical protein
MERGRMVALADSPHTPLASRRDNKVATPYCIDPRKSVFSDDSCGAMTPSLGISINDFESLAKHGHPAAWFPPDPDALAAEESPVLLAPVAE